MLKVKASSNLRTLASSCLTLRWSPNQRAPTSWPPHSPARLQSSDWLTVSPTRETGAQQQRFVGSSMQRSEVNCFTPTRTPSCTDCKEAAHRHCLAPRTEAERDLNRSPLADLRRFNTNSMVFQRFVSSAPIQCVPAETLPAAFTWHCPASVGKKKGKSYHFILVCCHGNQPTVGTLRQWYAGKLCGPLWQPGCSTFFLF